MLPIRKAQTWLPTIFNDLLGNEWVAKVNDAAPSMNIIECDERYRVEIAAPGMTKDDLSIEIRDENHLVVTMEKKCECENKEKPAEEKKTECGCDEGRREMMEKVHGKYLRREFSYSQFRQTLILPENVDKTKITAKQENGILTILIPKKESVIEAQAVKKITIE